VVRVSCLPGSLFAASTLKDLPSQRELYPHLQLSGSSHKP
jgi:hypothetical protein